MVSGLTLNALSQFFSALTEIIAWDVLFAYEQDQLSILIYFFTDTGIRTQDLMLAG
jgi:hypothetical protein